jgi:hypothetical protein
MIYPTVGQFVRNQTPSRLREVEGLAGETLVDIPRSYNVSCNTISRLTA